MLRLAIVLAVVSFAGMVLIDRALGSRAEFLNAWSVVERLLGRPPGAGTSVVAQHLGAPGELAAVVIANAAIGTLLAAVVRLAARLAS